MADGVIGKVCTIVLNWNGWQDTCECLDSLLASKRVPDTIIVVDNGSSDNSVEQISNWGREHFKSILSVQPETTEYDLQDNDWSIPFVLICNAENLGYAGGNNKGLSFILNRGDFAYIWLLNNDTIVETDSLSKLLTCAQTSKAAVFGTTVVYAGNPDLVQCAGGCCYNPFTTVFKFSLGDMPLDKVLAISEKPALDYIYGASMFVRSDVFKTCGLLNEEFFLFYEEIDFCKRVMRHGFDLLWCHEAIVIHKVSQTVGQPKTNSKDKLTFVNYHENLSTLLFSWRFYKPFFPFIFCFRFFGKLVILLTRKEPYLIRSLLSAYWSFLFRR